MKISVSNEKNGCYIVVVYVATGFSNFAIQYLSENEIFLLNLFACSFGAQVESFKQNKNGQKSCDTVPLRLTTVQEITESI